MKAGRKPCEGKGYDILLTVVVNDINLAQKVWGSTESFTE